MRSEFEKNWRSEERRNILLDELKNIILEKLAEAKKRELKEDEQRRIALEKERKKREIEQRRIAPGRKEKEKLFNRVIAEIKDFKPARKQLELEYNYQLNLHGYLSKTFPSTRIEEQRGSSRPDIVIDNIAIEIKGPTKSQDLKTIADKCMRYGEHFPDGIIIVLFEVKVNDRYYKEWLEGIKKYFPQVEVIRM